MGTDARRALPNKPSVALHPDITPGNCWAFFGTQGSLTVHLARPVQIVSIGLEHTPWSSSWVHTSAPREFRVVAYLCKDRSGSLPHVSSEQVELGVFEYQVGPSSKHLQVFAVPEEILSTDAAQAANVCMVRLDILSNHGNKDYTCLYRFRVHGRSTWSSDVVS